MRESGSDGWRVSNFAYDDLGRLRLEQQPVDAAGVRPATAYMYDLHDNLVKVTEPGDVTTWYRYDQLGRCIEIVQPDPDLGGPLGHPVTHMVYDLSGSLVSETRFDSTRPSLAVTTSYQNDALGRMFRVVGADPDGNGPEIGSEVTYHYDALGNRVSETERIAVGQYVTTWYRYDRHGRLWMTTSPASANSETERISIFDRVGNEVRRLEKTANLAGVAQYRQTDFEYDNLNRLVAQIDPGLAVTADRPATYYAYDASGNVRFVRGPSGTWTEYQYDALSQLVAVVEPATDDHASPVTRYEYAVTGDLQAVIDPLGRRVEYEYDNFGRLLTERRGAIQGVPDSVSFDAVQYAYDTRGNLTRLVDSDDNRVELRYDALDRPIWMAENDAVTQKSYDGLGRLAAITDPLGNTTRYGYDLLGRHTITIAAHPQGGAPLQLKMDDEQAGYAGHWYQANSGWQGSARYALLSESPAATATWAVSQLQTGATYEVLMTWDENSLNTDQARVTLRDGDRTLDGATPLDQRHLSDDVVQDDRAWQRVATVTLTSESLKVELSGATTAGRLVADGIWIVQVTGNSYTRYDTRGNVIAESDALGNVRQYTYDQHSHQLSSTDENGDTTRYEYDLLGHLTAVIDPADNVTTYEYDALDHVVAERIQWDGEWATTRYVYDAAGNLRQVIDRLGRVRTMNYDELGRVQDEWWYATLSDAAVATNPLNTIHHVYDAAGRLVSVGDDSSRFEYTLDTLDRVVHTTVDTVSAPLVDLHSSYSRRDDLRDRLSVQIGGVEDLVNQYVYDARSRLSRIEQSGPGVQQKRVTWDYTAGNQISTIDRYVGGSEEEPIAQTDYQYDGQGRLVTLSHTRDGDPLAEYSWIFDASSRIVQEDSLLDGVVHYQYDSRGQLMSFEGNEVSGQSFTYDANGNRAMAGYDVDDRNLVGSDGVFQYQYDAEGNRTERVEIATGKVTRYEWDVLNRLTAITEHDNATAEASCIIRYTYDVLGRRIGKSVRPSAGPEQMEAYVYDAQDMLLRFVDGELADRYLHGPAVDQILADEQVGEDGMASDVLWPLTDHLGSVRDLARYDTAEQSVLLAQHTEYDAFGNIVDMAPAAVDFIFGFTGRETDAESDLYYYRARYYDPHMGQFLSEDPLGFDAGDANLRRYVDNSPTNYVDPTGLYGDDVHFYFNYYLARYLGLDQPSGWVNSNGKPISEAYIIAYFATRIDYDAYSRPVGAGQTARSHFHFPAAGAFQSVRRNDPRVYAALNTVGATGDLEMFGLLLHTYQDSFAHEGHSSGTGHASDKKADVPFYHPWRDVEMSIRVYDEMVNLLLARRGIAGGPRSPEARKLLAGKSFANFWVQVDTVLLQDPTKSAQRIRLCQTQALLGATDPEGLLKGCASFSR